MDWEPAINVDMVNNQPQIQYQRDYILQILHRGSMISGHGSEPSSAFEKWYGHGTLASKGLVRGVWGTSPKKIFLFKMSVEAILMHFEITFFL